MKVKEKWSNPHCLPVSAFRKSKSSRGNNVFPPLNLFIRQRLKALNIGVENIQSSLGISKTKAYLVCNGWFVTDYDDRCAFADLIKVPLKTLVLWEHGLLEDEEIPNFLDGVYEIKKEIDDALEQLAIKFDVSLEYLKELVG